MKRRAMLLICCLVLDGCSSGRSTASSDPILVRLRECRVIGDGELALAIPSWRRTCTERCLRSEPCSSVRAFACQSGENTVVTCIESCLGGDVQRCADETPYLLQQRCDGEYDCDDDSDELSCGHIPCGSAGFTPFWLACDGQSDCPDGSDEINCAVFVCDSGATILSRERCNGLSECSQGEDEVGCATPACR